jgi:hypothetical protein
MLGTVSAQAQYINSYRAHVPFDFTIGKKSYDAGNYMLNVKSPTSLATNLTVRNAERKELQALVVLMNGNRSKTDETILVFNRYGDVYVLKQIISPEFGYSAPKSRIVTTVRVEEDKTKIPDVVSIVLTR